jgi:ATP-dependent metalloprotease FtsH
MLKKFLDKFFPLARKELPIYSQEISAVDPSLTLELQKGAPKFFAFLTSKDNDPNVDEHLQKDMLKEKKFDIIDDLKIKRNTFFGLSKESVEGYIGNQFAQFLTKLNQSNQGLLVRQYFEKLNLLNDFRGESARQYLLAVSRSPVPFFLSKRPTLPPITEQRPLYVQPRQSNARLAYKLFQLSLFILFLLVLMRQLGLGKGDGDDDSSPFSSLKTKDFKPSPIPLVKFANVKGNAEAKNELTDLVGYLAAPTKYENVKIPKGILLYGPPGTGKTLLAKALAGEAGVPFISVSGSDFDEMFVGVGQKRMKKLFKDARLLSPCIIFIDEIDGIGGRDKFRFHENATLNQLLVELDGFTNSTGVILIGATNTPDNLDKALLRPGRFDRLVHIQYPDVTARQEILEYYLSQHNNVSKEVKVNLLARETSGNTGADLENLVNLAAINAIKHKKELIEMNEIEEALMTVLMGKERKTFTQNENAKKRTAYHEGGHALVALLTDHSPEIRKATILPRGQALGMVNYLENDDDELIGQSKQQFIALMKMAMGGRAAEEVIYGKEHVTTGASNDFQQATKIAHRMVTRLGMSELGLTYLSEENIGNKKAYADMNVKVEREIKHLLDDSYGDAKKILTDNIDSLHKVAAALMRYETLDKTQLEKIIRGESIE